VLCCVFRLSLSKGFKFLIEIFMRLQRELKVEFIKRACWVAFVVTKHGSAEKGLLCGAFSENKVQLCNSINFSVIFDDQRVIKWL
jgi:hypothetical protein